MTARAYDRRAQSVASIVALEHVNVAVPDQRLATLFYVVALGGTRDPYLMVGDDNMWINFGRQQFHLPTRGTQVLRGRMGLVVPDLEALRARLAAARRKLEHTLFGFRDGDGCVEVTCPWGNRLRCHAPGPRFGDMRLGIPYVEFDVAGGAAPGIACFYEAVFGVKAVPAPDGASVAVPAGGDQMLVFRETAAPLPPFDGHHIAIYVADFGAVHDALARHGLITEESNEHQYRFRDIVDPAGGARLFEIEHEVRSLTHPLYARPLVNRNPAQSTRNYQRGRDAYWG
jgi:catechol 2,3-dioxygenase-like lactoylglutathione lyase family enzyme